MTRQECYEYIVSNNLRDEVRATLGKTYSSCSTEVLQRFIESRQKVKATLESQGLSRKECFDVIIKNNMKESIKNTYGKPYNSVSTEELNKFIRFNSAFEVATDKNTPNDEGVEVYIPNICIDADARKVLRSLCEVLNMQDLLVNLE